MKTRHAVLAAAAIATGMATFWVSPHEAHDAQAIVQPARDVKASAAGSAVPADDATSGAADAIVPDRVKPRRPFPAAAADPFAARSWAPPAPVKARAPVAPPLPYAYFGRITEGGAPRVFLQRGERTYTVARGDVLDRDYRVEEIAPAAVTFTYLPLAQRQVLHTGSPQQ